MKEQVKEIRWKVKIETKLKESILDPQGQAVKGGLEALGYKNVAEVEIGKYMELLIEGLPSADRVREQVDEMCKRLLANPVIEDYQFQIEEMEG